MGEKGVIEGFEPVEMDPDTLNLELMDLTLEVSFTPCGRRRELMNSAYGEVDEKTREEPGERFTLRRRKRHVS